MQIYFTDINLMLPKNEFKANNCRLIFCFDLLSNAYISHKQNLQNSHGFKL